MLVLKKPLVLFRIRVYRGIHRFSRRCDNSHKYCYNIQIYLESSRVFEVLPVGAADKINAVAANVERQAVGEEYRAACHLGDLAAIDQKTFLNAQDMYRQKLCFGIR